MIATAARVEEKYAKGLEEFLLVYYAIGNSLYCYYLDYKITTKNYLTPLFWFSFSDTLSKKKICIVTSVSSGLVIIPYYLLFTLKCLSRGTVVICPKAAQSWLSVL